MLSIDLSALSRAELNRLLDSARSRGQTGLEQRLLAELQARNSTARRPVAVPPATPAPAPVKRASPPASRARFKSRAAGLSIAAAAALVLGWGVNVNLDAAPWTFPPNAAPPAPLAPAPRAAVALVSLSETPIAPEITPRAALPEPARPTATPPTLAAIPCYDRSTPADRLVCRYPSLAIRDSAMKDAYARALDAGADPVALATSQAAWRARSARISEWPALADAYDQRIREVETAAAASSTQAGNP